MKKTLREINIQVEVRHLNNILSLMGGPLWVEVFWACMLSLLAFVYVYAFVYKHTHIHSDQQNGANNVSTLLDMDD